MRLLFPLLLVVAACSDKTEDTDTDVDTTVDTEVDTEPDTEPDTEATAQCSGAQLFEAPFTVSGDDFFADYAAAGDFNTGPGCDTGTSPNPQPVAVVELDAEAGQVVRVRETGPMDSMVYVMDGCVAGDACLASHDDPDGLFEYIVPSTGRVVLALTAYSGFDAGNPYDFSVEVVQAEVCGNDLDDDGDGAFDCGDSDCDDVCDGVCGYSEITLPFSSTVSVDSGANTTRFLDCVAPDALFGYDLVEFDLAAGESFRLSTDDTVLGIVVAGCSTGAQCADFVAESPYYSPLGETVLLAVLTDSQGAYTLERLPAEVCNNGIDDSGNGLIDCEDVERCGTEPVCVFECPPIETLPYTASGSNWVAEHDDGLSFQREGGCVAGETDVGETGGDLVVPVQLSAGDRIRIAESSTFDSIVNVVRGTCSTAGLGNTCVASNDDDNGEELIFEAPATDTYYIAVSSYFNVDISAYDLTIERLVEDCTGNDDADLDGLAGCDDPDCSSVSECAIQCDLPNFLPVRDSGDNFSADYDNLYDFVEVDGCEGGSSFNGGGGDALYTVFPNPGDTIRVRETGSVDAIVNITAGDGACTPLRSDNTCVFSVDDGEDDAAVRLYEVSEDVAHHINVSSYSGADSGSYNIEVDVIPEFECGSVLDTGVHTFTGDNWSEIWPDEVARIDSGGCVGSEQQGGDAMFRALLFSGDVIVVQDLNDGGVDHIVNITTDACGDGSQQGITCVYGDDDPLGFGFPEIYTYVYSGPPLSVNEPVMHTIQVGAYSSTTSDEPFNFTVSILRD